MANALRMTDERVAERERRIGKAREERDIRETYGKCRDRAKSTPGKPTKAKPPTEHQEQVTVIEWWDRIYAPAHKLDLRLLFAVPNGGERHPAVAAKLKAEGVRAGCPDLILAIPKSGKFYLRRGNGPFIRESHESVMFSGLFIEMKRIGGKASPAQLEFATILRNQGYNVIIAQGASEAMRAITGYLES